MAQYGTERSFRTKGTLWHPELPDADTRGRASETTRRP
jgi:hypothetical protein